MNMNSIRMFKMLCCMIIHHVVTTDGHFGYTQADQRRWYRKHRECAGKYQSPIAIYTSKAISLSMPAIEMVGYHNLLPGPLTMHNNGHSVSMSIPKPNENDVDDEPSKDGSLPYIFGGRLEDEYEVEGLHFHWGDKNMRGSEHVLNDIRYPMEMHIIHRNKKYASVPEALKFEDGLCVLGFFYQLKEVESPELLNIVRNISDIEDYNHSILLNSTFALTSLLGNIDLERFYTYKGSLTTPPCSEAVTWIIYPDPIPISISQMNKFRRLSNSLDSIIVDNFRKLQPLGNRNVFVRKVNVRNTKLDSISNEVHYTDWKWLF